MSKTLLEKARDVLQKYVDSYSGMSDLFANDADVRCLTEKPDLYSAACKDAADEGRAIIDEINKLVAPRPMECFGSRPLVEEVGVMLDIAYEQERDTGVASQIGEALESLPWHRGVE